jgi:hypothetical protein
MKKSSPTLAISLHVVAFLVTATAAFGQIVVNEILAANDTTNPNNSDFDDYADWIELRNTTAEEVSLDGYYLSDDDEPTVIISVPGGFYPGNQEVTLSTSSPGATVRFTLDGSRLRRRA